MQTETLQGNLEQPLTHADRCDRCGAQAYVRVTLPSTLELLFCGHDWREHGDVVKLTAVKIQDELHKLVATP